ncbi:MAG: LamG-like jellyroll fold domain-containing protein [Rufibacter sp.]
MKTTRWPLESLTSIGGHEVTVIGDPKVVKTEDGAPAIAFNGVDNGLLVAANPILGAEEFTIYVVFKPAAAWPANFEQRFLHLQDPANPNRRILLELRLNNRQQWYPDFFLRTDSASLTLIDSTKTFPVNEWATMSLVYKKGEVQGYVNGKLQLSGKILYQALPPTAQVSIGTRMDKRSWFNGQIKSVTFTPKAVVPAVR